MTRTLSELGFQVIVCSGEREPVDLCNLGEGEVEGSIRYVGLEELPSKASSPLQKSVQIFAKWGAKTVEWLDRQAERPAYIFVYGGGAPYIFRILCWARKHRIPVIADVVEWYDPRQLTGGRFGPFNISMKLALRLLYPRCAGVVGISRLLEDYYRDRGVPVVRIPPTLDVFSLDLESSSRRDGPVRLIYAGTPGAKDLLKNVILAFENHEANDFNIELYILGPDVTEVVSLLEGREIPRNIKVIGRVGQAEVFEHIRQADFSVLLRESERFAHAGFPTKFVESMANGTPVIANLTGDLELYLQDAKDGLVCFDYSVAALIAVLSRLPSISRESLKEMRISARARAEQSFDFRQYVQDMNRFLTDVDANYA